MTSLFTFILIAYGASNIMVFGSIFKGWRAFWKAGQDEAGFFGKLFGCMMCLPFWWGVILSLTFYSPCLASESTIDIPYINTFFDGCLASGSVWLIHTLQEYFERK
jgi:hypothetical protein